MQKRKMEKTLRILSNVEGLNAAAAADASLQVVTMSTRPSAFIRQCLTSDLVIIDNSGQGQLYIACLLRAFARFRLVSVDVILRPASGPKTRLIAAVKRLLLRHVDRFILFFRNTSGYERHYGVDPRKIAYVPFKVNGRDEGAFPTEVPDGDHVLCAGRTLRDVNTFVAAMAAAGCPAMLLQQKREFLHAHGSEQYQSSLPENVRLHIDTGEQLSTFIDFIARTKIVVIPRYRTDIAATGISTYLIAMALGKCVVISRGPGADDVLTDQAVFVEPENTEELAKAVRDLWSNDARRRAIGAAAKRYAESCGGTQRLAGDILSASLNLLAPSGARRKTGPAAAA
jgi:glycosyltransferase involved in cell wall biosynthesis